MSDYKRTAQLLTYGMPAYTLLTIAYLLLLFLLPASPKTVEMYKLTDLNYHVLMFLIAMPSIMVWFVAFLSHSMLKSYAEAIRKTKEGASFNRLATGAAWLAWSLPIAAISSLILNSIYYKNSDFQASSVIIANYISLLLPLIGFVIINDAASQLFARAKLTFNLFSSRVLTMFFVGVGVAYCFLTFRNFDLSSISSSSNPYFLPIWLMVLTVTIPFLYAWFVGILACYEINLYSRAVKGVFYRQSLRLLAIGLIIVIASFIAQQYTNSVLPRIGYVTLDFKIVLLVIFRMFTAVGFGLVALGAVRLKKIEEV